MSDPSLGTRLRIERLASRHLPITHWLVDSAIWAVALPFSVLLRYDYSFAPIALGLIWPVLLAVGLQEVVGISFGQYRRRWRYGSFDELKVVCATALVVGVMLTIVLWSDDSVPRSVPALATAYSMLGHIAVRSLWRAYSSRQRRAGGPSARRTVIVGAGDAAAQVLNMLVDSPAAPVLPVALVDDDPDKRGLRIRGVRVVADTGSLVDVALTHQADTVLIAVPSGSSSFVRHITQLSEAANLEVLLLPPVNKLFGPVLVSDIRPVRHSDLLGREPADIDTAAVAGYVTGRRVMVTGAGGSIGSELCRQLTAFDPSELLLLDRDESGLHATQLSIHGQAMLDDPGLILADIRDADRMDEVFEQYRPDVVFHTAALKHLPLLEMHPDEGWKTNVLGTLNVLEAAGRHGVDRFVNVSTDKAANPTSVLGWTKRITERLTAHHTTIGDTDCVSVRFGNVLGSNGSVLKAFEAQADRGGPITVTHPDITRYFMTVAEAARLTIYAGAIGDPGEVLILDMGEPVRIVDVAARFARRHDPPLEIVFTGLRTNEKLHEDLVATNETGVQRVHHLITHVSVPPLSSGPIRVQPPGIPFSELARLAVLDETPTGGRVDETELSL